jgi:phosphatidylglycerophosphate synthase
MLDGFLKPKIDPALDALAKFAARRRISANAITLAGCGLGLLAAFCVAKAYFWLAIALIGISRIADGLDGAVARRAGTTDFGGYLDIVLDFLFYGAIPLGFVALDPQANGLPGAVLLLSFYFNGASFLAFAILAERKGFETKVRGTKSLFFTTGLAEASETIAVFIAMCVWPQWFDALAYGFAAVCFYTAIARIVLARATFDAQA